MEGAEQLDVTSFLPAYSGVEAMKGDAYFSFYSDRMPEGYDREFIPSTYLKREFHSLKLPAIEPPRPPGAPFKPLHHQSFVTRFLSSATPYDRLLVFHAVGTGKCLGRTQQVLLYDGTLRQAQYIQPGDLLMGDDSKPRTVVSIARGRESMYRIKQKNGGEDYTCNESHILTLKVSGQKRLGKIKNRGLDYIVARYWDTQRNKDQARWFRLTDDNEAECRAEGQHWLDQQLNITTVDMELRDYLALNKNARSYYKGYRVGVDWPEQSVSLDPYFVGLWLGDGTSCRPEITSADQAIVDYLEGAFPGHELKKRGDYSYYISADAKGGSNPITDALRDLGLLKNKHIPQVYKANSRVNRLKLLAGLLDTDGYLDRRCGYYEIVQKSQRLATDIVFLARSLSFRAQVKEVTKTCVNAPGGPKKGTYHKVTISGDRLHEIPVLLERKKCAPTTPNKDQLCGAIDVEPIGEDDYYGFVIDANHRFLLGDFTVTHNTCLFSMLSEMIQDENPNMLPTLVLTRSEVLENNAKSEIAQVCTQGKYIPSRWDPKLKRMISPEAYVKRLNKAISERYVFNTWERIAKELAANDLDYIREVYSNRVIVIDEAHGLRVQPGRAKSPEELARAKEQQKVDINVYNQIYCLLHTVKNCKILLLTATPMRDRAKEIAYPLNLLLPEDKRLDPDTFEATYFEDGQFRPDMKAEFKARLRGIVSYVRETNSNVQRKYEGILVPNYLGEPRGMRKTPLELAPMSALQSKAYERAYGLDRKGRAVEEIDESDEPDEEEEEESGGKAGLYKNSRQASLFVAPDGTYGGDLERKWLQLSQEQRERRERAKQLKAMTPEEKEIDKRERVAAKRATRQAEEKAWEEAGLEPPKGASRGKKGKARGSEKVERPQRPLREKLSSVTDALKKAIWGGASDPGNEVKLANLAKMSSKYAGVIRQLIEHPTEKAFVYCNLVVGSGCNLFAALLELFNFEHVNVPAGGGEPDLEKYRSDPKGRRRFMLITSKFPTNRQASYIVNKVYNDPSNKYGDLVQVIVASRIVSEGISFKHTRQFHNLTPGWNETETSQAMGRIIRAFAHDVFTDPLERFVKIFRWCSMPRDPNFPSIDFEMYRLSEDKDYPIKQVERLLKEAAVDCALNVARNQRPGQDQTDSRECDYQSCVYACDDIPAAWYAVGGPGPDKPLIDDTYNLYYAREQIDGIKEELRGLFRVCFMYDFFELRPRFPFRALPCPAPGAQGDDRPVHPSPQQVWDNVLPSRKSEPLLSC